MTAKAPGKKRRLGRGLEALMGDSAGPGHPGGTDNVPLYLIDPNPCSLAQTSILKALPSWRLRLRSQACCNLSCCDPWGPAFRSLPASAGSGQYRVWGGNP